MTNFTELKEMYIDTPYINGILEGLEDFGYDADQAEEIINNEQFMIYEDCESMSDVAYYVALYNGWLEGPWGDYMDFDKLGNDLDIEGTYIQIDTNTFAEIF